MKYEAFGGVVKSIFTRSMCLDIVRANFAVHSKRTMRSDPERSIVESCDRITGCFLRRPMVRNKVRGIGHNVMEDQRLS